jgi:NAD(P)-dependent dehydrogenase (short-subunit alcohol dehydrogenase family)
VPPALEGRSALITGASQGLGVAIAKAFVAAGADVMLCARNARKLEESAREVQQSAGANQRVRFHVADVSDQTQVAELVRVTLTEFPKLIALVNNAGIYGPKGALEETDWEEWVNAIKINLLGSVLTCRALLPHFKRRGYGKIIQLSGGGATNPLPRLSSYATSKAAIVRFAETLAEETREDGICVNCIAPGALNTQMLDQVLAAGPEVVGKQFYERAIKQRDSGGAPLEAGAGLAVYLASAESDAITGKLLSAIWDPWSTLAQHSDEIRSTDVYTLRRIVPKDRGISWG